MSVDRRTGTFALLLILLPTACSEGQSDGETDDLEPLECEVAIVGGGAGGLHTAFRLAPELGEGVCLFEREATLGGRIHDLALDESDPDAPRVGTGARRVAQGHAIVFALAEELGIEFEVPDPAIDLINARGAFAFSSQELIQHYGIEPDPDPDVDQETWFYDQLRFGPKRAMIDDYPDFRSYVIDVIGPEGYAFLRDMSRFRADFEYPLDARGYLDYLDEEWESCCEAAYPIGGMSAFVRGMQASTIADGGRIFTSETVVAIERAAEGGYRLETSEHSVHAAEVVIAVPPVALDSIRGDIVDEIRSDPVYQDILGVKVVTITQWWPEAWWADIVNPNLATDNHVWRAWTTEHCLNFIEIPMEPYAAAQQVTRSVYDDDLDCALFWEAAAREGIDVVEAEVANGLRHLFDGNGITTPAMIDLPVPLKTHVQVWPAAWHWLGAGAGVTNAELFEWAVEPLPGEDVALVGEAYNVQRSGWSLAAYESSIHWLEARHGMSL